MVYPIQLQWPVDNHVVNQKFGENPDFYKPFKLPGHEGLDLWADTNANVYAAANGTVTMAAHPNNHPYGLHIRIRHQQGKVVFETIYAHLAEVFVKPNEKVVAGQRIGLADNTGNSFGSHLHLTLKIAGASTPGYPAGIVDPLPYLSTTIVQPPVVQPPVTLPTPSGIIAYAIGAPGLHSGPDLQTALFSLLNDGEPLQILGDAAAARPKIGVAGAILQVKRANGQTGWVDGKSLRLTGQAPPATGAIVYPTDTLNVRVQPNTTSNILTMVTTSDPLTVLGDLELAKSKIGKQGEWLNVKTPGGFVGFVAAWFVDSEPTPASFAIGPGAVAPAGSLVYPWMNLKVRAQPAKNSPAVDQVKRKATLKVIGDPSEAREKIGKKDEWLFVESTNGERGWVPAWVVSIKK